MSDYNYEKLRNDLLDYFGTATFNVSNMAIVELIKVEQASEDELIQLAIANNFDLDKYLIKVDKFYKDNGKAMSSYHYHVLVRKRK